MIGGARFNPQSDEAIITNINANRAAAVNPSEAPDKMYTGAGPLASGARRVINYITDNPTPAANVPTAADRSNQVAGGILSTLKSWGRGAQPELAGTDSEFTNKGGVFNTKLVQGVKNWDSAQRNPDAVTTAHENFNPSSTFTGGVAPLKTPVLTTAPDPAADAELLKTSPGGVRHDVDALGAAMKQAGMGLTDGKTFGGYSNYTRNADGSLSPVDSSPTPSAGGAYNIESRYNDLMSGAGSGNPFALTTGMPLVNQQVSNDIKSTDQALEASKAKTEELYKGGIIKHYTDNKALQDAQVRQIDNNIENSLSKEEQLKLAGENARQTRLTAAEGHILANQSLSDQQKTDALAQLRMNPETETWVPRVEAKKGVFHLLKPSEPEVKASGGFVTKKTAIDPAVALKLKTKYGGDAAKARAAYAAGER